MKRFGILLVMLALSSLACQGIQINLYDTPAPAVATPAIPGAVPPVQPPLIQLPNLSGVQLGDEYRDEGCGYSFRRVPGYTFDVTTGFGPEMTAPGASAETGPTIMLLCGVRDNARTNADVIAGLTANNSGTPENNPITYSNQKNVRIGGVDAVIMDIEGTAAAGVVVKGRQAVAMVTPYRGFVIVGMAPADKWEETRTYFEAVMSSVSFFEPTVTPTP